MASGSAPPSPPSAYPSMETVYAELQAITDGVKDERSALNTRASFILGSASIVVGAVTGVLGAIATHPLAQRTIVDVGLAGGVILYLFVVYFAWRAYTTDTLKQANPFQLLDFLPYPDDDTKQAIMRSRLANFVLDREEIARKTGFTVVALIFLLAEVAWLALLLIVVVFMAG